ncbi:MAG: tetratricopeptide repeat protein [bacterium]
MDKNENLHDTSYPDDTYQLDIKIKSKDDRYAVTLSARDCEEETFFVTPDEILGILGHCRLLDSFLSNKEPGRFSGDIIQLGSEIFQRFVQPCPHFNNTMQSAKSHNMPILISIRTSDQDTSLIPWELLYSEESGFLALDPRFQLIRSTPLDGAESTIALSARPLRVLFMACSPKGTNPLLNYEREEEIIMDALADLKRNNELEIDIAEGGTLDEMEKMLANKDYHVVHLSSHGFYDREIQTGYLLMEGESGMEKRVSAKEFAEKLIGSRSVRLLFLSACQSGSETEQNTGLAQSLIANGIPMVIGMKYSVMDAAAVLIAESFYKNLTLRRTVSHALQQSRQAYAKKYPKSFQWIIPALFARDANLHIVDWKKPVEKTERKSSAVILYGRVKHLKTGFRGRRSEQREFMNILRRGEPPALCITGAGGIGKSTLASWITDRLHASGYLVIPLYGDLSPDIFIEKTINALIAESETEHIQYLKGLTDYRERIVYILSKVLGIRDTLYLLDNFEENLKKSEQFRAFKNSFWEETFRTLLQELPHTNSRLLITCRYTIPGIGEDLLYQTSLKEMSGVEARKLMIFNDDFSEIESKHIREIYSTIGGNPKAINELGKLIKEGNYQWSELKEKLESMQKKMREFTIFEELYHFLSEPERSFFRKISVYQGPVTREGLKLHEPDEQQMDRHIGKLVDYTLLQEYRDETSDIPLYQVHPLNRGHIKKEWWREKEQETAHSHAAEYYLDIRGTLNIEDLSRAVYHLRGAKKFDRMVDLIIDYEKELNLKGYWDESLYLHNIILEENSNVEKKYLGIANNNIGEIYSNKGEWDKALERFLESEKILIELRDRARLAIIYNNIGEIYRKKGECDKALEYFLKSKKILIEVDNRDGLAHIYNNIGLIYSDKSEWNKAIELFLKSEKIWIESEYRAGLAYAYNNLGYAYLNKGEWDKALEFFLKSEKICIEERNMALLALIYNNIGGIYLNKSEWDKAFEFFLKSEKICIKVGDRANLAYAYNNIGLIYYKKGEWNKALEFYLKSEKKWIEVGARARLAYTYNNIGLICSNKGEWDKALEFYLKSEKKLIEVGDRAGLASTYFNMGTAYLNKNDKETGNNYIILAGFIAMTQGMQYKLSQNARALEPILKEIGEERFMEIGRKLAREKGLIA